jgi:TolA-binding protein
MKKNILLLNVLLLLLFGCSKPTDKEYMLQAKENAENNNIADAVTAYESLIKNYPESELAPEAIVQLASIYHNNLVINISQNESLKKSAGLFKSVFEKYPDNEQAPYSLFMAGFIYANDLKDYESAKETYNLFLNEFPEHELASSAREELEYMGLSPEEILRKKIAVEQ